MMSNFSWKQAAYCAKLSMYAYQDEAGFRKVIERDGLDIKFFGGKYFFL